MPDILFLFATTLVALWTPDKLVIGADSLVVMNDRPPTASACKISQEGSTFFAMSGLVEDQAAGLSVMSVAREAVRTTDGFPSRVEQFVSAVQPKLEKAVELLKVDARRDYEYLRAGHPILQAIFADLQNGTPVMATVGFNLDRHGMLHPQMNVIAQGAPRLIYAGQQGRIREYLRSNRNWFGPDNDGFIRNLVQLEVDANSGRVGGPVDLLALDANGPKWLQKKPECR